VTRRLARPAILGKPLREDDLTQPEINGANAPASLAAAL
jgi:hypothetical protein